LKTFLEAQGYRHREELDADLGVLIVFVQAPLQMLLKARRLGIPVLLRLDGVYYPRKHGYFHRDYLRINLKVWIIRKLPCAFIICPSHFSKDMLDNLLRRTQKPWRIVHNGTGGAVTFPRPAARSRQS